MKTYSIATLLGASAIALTLISCKSKREEVREDKIEQEADRIEEKADNVRANADATADKIEDKADAVRKTE